MCRAAAYLPLMSGRAYALLRRVSTATKSASTEEEWNGSEVCSTTDSSNANGTTGLWSMPCAEQPGPLPVRPKPVCKHVPAH